jgi:hypothetical protein
MRLARPVTPLLLGLLVVSGCRTAGIDNLARREPPPPRPALDARTVIAEHNRNAERIETLEAAPSMTVSAGRKGYGVNGHMALERPRNFKLELSHTGTEVADIGSNDEKFWFWIRDNGDKAVYFCNYEDADDSALATTLQPDWIVEALGLRVIPEEEMGDYRLTRGSKPGELVLTHKPTVSRGETITRVTIISEEYHRIREHQLYAGDQKELLARAVIDSYMKIMPADESGEAVYIPQKMKLEWRREKMSMEVTLVPSTTKVNTVFTDEVRAARFVQGTHKGYEPRNLAGDLPRPSGDTTTVRETRPIPPAGVQLGQPAPLGVEGSARAPRDPVALSADLPNAGTLGDRLVGPSMPEAPELHFARPQSTRGWRPGSASSFER